ncbi:hypothetical protein ABZ686_20795 [Streptomyces sp. NPDC006992]|uniref:hypothetical protein n=1 Tax=Streptomyces sp. NPDC006992 TaxID=3155601 RepID=UPI0033D7EC95
MTSRREHPTNAPGASPAHRAGRTTHHHVADTAAECADADLNGLFTYCLAVLCEHESALAALGEALALADRQRGRGRAPEGEHALRPWLYALARWACARRLADQRAREREERGASAAHECAAGPAVARRGAGTRAAGRPPAPAASPPVPPASPTAERTALLGDGRPGAGHLPSGVRRRRELAALAWPEAAGTSSVQREALELSVRHGLSAAQIAAVLSLSPTAAEELLLHAACEVERTRAALHVVESGGCAAVARLAGDERLLLGTALRRELVEHVDDCPQCRRAAERAMAGVSWPGTAPASAALAVVAVPRPAVEAAVALARRARAQRTPRFDRAGYPQREQVRPARRDRLRSRALTSTVVAAVLAAPVVALWAAYRGAPTTGEAQADRSATAPDTADDGRGGGAGGPGTLAPPTGSHARRAAPDGAVAGPAGRAAPSRSHALEPPVREPGAPSAPTVQRPASEPAAAPHRSVPVSRPAAAEPSIAASAPSGDSPADSGPPSGSSSVASAATPSAAEPPPATSRPAFADIAPSGPPRAPSRSPS